jgi:hypothetical protein
MYTKDILMQQDTIFCLFIQIVFMEVRLGATASPETSVSIYQIIPSELSEAIMLLCVFRRRWVVIPAETPVTMTDFFSGLS